MESTLNNVAIEAGREIVITRHFAAPRPLVFAVWTDPRHMVHWWGPNGFTTPLCEFDARPGGAIRIHMLAPDGSLQLVTGRVEEIVEPELLVFSTALPAEDGTPIFEGLNSVTFDERDGGTTITLTARVVSTNSDELGDLAGMNVGWSQSIERLAAHAERIAEAQRRSAAFDGPGISARHIVAARSFDAPRPLVFKVWTDPAHVVHWWGPKGFTNTIETMDARPGGEWIFTMHGPDGVDYPNHILFVEVAEPERIVYLHGSGADEEPEEFRSTITFDEESGRTRISIEMVFKSAAERDEVAEKYGAVEGLNSTLDSLAEYLASQQ